MEYENPSVSIAHTDKSLILRVSMRSAPYRYTRLKLQLNPEGRIPVKK